MDSEILEIFFGMFFVCGAIITVTMFLYLLFCNEENYDILIRRDIKKFFKRVLMTIGSFILVLFFCRPVGWLLSFDEDKDWELSNHPYAVEELSSKVTYDNGYYKFSVYDHKSGLPSNRAMSKNVSSIYYRNIEDPYVEWYKDVSKMLMFKAERTRIVLYLPNSWRNN